MTEKVPIFKWPYLRQNQLNFNSNNGKINRKAWLGGIEPPTFRMRSGLSAVDYDTTPLQGPINIHRTWNVVLSRGKKNGKSTYKKVCLSLVFVREILVRLREGFNAVKHAQTNLNNKLCFGFSAPRLFSQNILIASPLRQCIFPCCSCTPINFWYLIL